MSAEEKIKYQTLVVDDSATILATAKKMLGEEYIVHTAKDGQEAWDIITTNEEISVIFSDMQMPIMNGMQLLLKIRESENNRISKLPVIMITGQSDTAAGKRAAFEIGATDFIGKPFDAMDLLSRARSNTAPQRRAEDRPLDSSKEVFITPSGFQNIGKESLVRARENNEEFSVVIIELTNIDDIKKSIDSKSVRQIIVSLVKRISGVLRERDVATRIGENKFALLLYTSDFNTRQAVERLCDYMKKLVFELHGKTLRTDLAYGYSTIDSYDKKSSFADICKQADTALGQAIQIKLGNKIASFNDDEVGPTGVGQIETTDLWPSLTHILDGDYNLVDESHVDVIVECMQKYLDHVRKRK